MREFLYEALADMHSLHIQDVLLRLNALFRAPVLSSPAQLQKALPSQNRLPVNSNSFMRIMKCTQSLLLVPAYSIGDIGIGVGVESCGGNGPSDPHISRKERILHSTGALLTLANCSMFYEFGYQKQFIYYFLFVIRFQFFSICDVLELALLRASYCNREISNITSNAVLRDISYRYCVTHIRGEHRMRTMVSGLRNRVQLNALSLASDCEVIRALNVDAYNHMKSWASTAMFSQVAPVAQLPLLSHDSSQSTNDANDSNLLALLLHGDRDDLIRV